MDKYEIIKKIMDSEIIGENSKVYYIETFLKGWYTEDDMKWIWE